MRRSSRIRPPPHIEWEEGEEDLLNSECFILPDLVEEGDLLGSLEVPVDDQSIGVVATYLQAKELQREPAKGSSDKKGNKDQKITPDLEINSTESTDDGDTVTSVLPMHVSTTSPTKQEDSYLTIASFQASMDRSISDIIDESRCLFQMDPREYHPFYLRIYKYIKIGQQHGYINSSSDETLYWEKYDKICDIIMGSEGGGSDREPLLTGEQSPYATYIKTGRVVVNGKEVNLSRNQIEINRMLEELVKSARDIVERRKRKRSQKPIKCDLRARLEFFNLCKTVTFPAECIRMNEIWHKFVNEFPDSPPTDQVNENIRRSARKRKNRTLDSTADILEGKNVAKAEYYSDSVPIPLSIETVKFEPGYYKELNEPKVKFQMIANCSRLSSSPPTSTTVKVPSLDAVRQTKLAGEVETFLLSESKASTLNNELTPIKTETEISIGKAKRRTKSLRRIKKNFSMSNPTHKSESDVTTSPGVSQSTGFLKGKKRVNQITKLRRLRQNIERKKQVHVRLENLICSNRSLPATKKSDFKRETDQNDNVENQLKSEDATNLNLLDQDTTGTDSFCYDGKVDLDVQQEKATSGKRVTKFDGRKCSLSGGGSKRKLTKLRKLRKPLPPKRREQKKAQMKLELLEMMVGSRKLPAKIKSCKGKKSGRLCKSNQKEKIVNQQSHPVSPSLPPSPISDHLSEIEKNEEVNEIKPAQDNMFLSNISEKTSRKKDGPTMCDECGIVFPGTRWVRRHKKSAHSGHSECPICQKKFQHGSSVWVHFQKEHTIEGLRRKGINDITDHRPKTSSFQHDANSAPMSDYFCELCGKVFDYRVALQRHMEQKHGSGDKKFQCCDCGKLFKAKDVMDAHRRQVHLGELFNCEYCSRKFQGPGKLWKHQVETHELTDLEPPPGVNIYKCDYCDEKLLRGMAQHVEKHHPEKIQEYKKKHGANIMSSRERSIQRKRKLRDEWKKTGVGPAWINRAHNPKKCSLCGIKLPFRNRDFWIRHLKEIHNEEPPKEASFYQPICPYVCEVPSCKKSYPELSNLESHMRRAHIRIEKALLEIEFVKRTDNQEYYSDWLCVICNCTLKSSEDVIIHYVMEHQETVDKLKGEMDITVSVITNPQLCPHHCENTFRTGQLLREHVETAHVEHCWKCPECDKLMISPADMQEHFMVEHDEPDRISEWKKRKEEEENDKLNQKQNGDAEMAPSYKCAIPGCDKAFPVKRYLTDHIRRVHNKPKKTKPEGRRGRPPRPKTTNPDIDSTKKHKGKRKLPTDVKNKISRAIHTKTQLDSNRKLLIDFKIKDCVVLVEKLT